MFFFVFSLCHHQAISPVWNESAIKRIPIINIRKNHVKYIHADLITWLHLFKGAAPKNSPVFSDKPINTGQRGGSLCERVRGWLTAFYQGGLISVCLISWEMYGNWTVREGKKRAITGMKQSGGTSDVSSILDIQTAVLYKQWQTQEIKCVRTWATQFWEIVRNRLRELA